MIDPRDVTISQFSREDVPDYREYFCGETNEAVRQAAGLKALTPEEKLGFTDRILKKIDDAENGGTPMVAVTVFYRGERMGFHPSTHFMPGKSIVMHAHFFRADLRGVGIGLVSYVKAMEFFFKHYGIQEIEFKTPTQNIGPMRIKEKLGLTAVGAETINWPALIRPLETKIFRVTPDQLPALRKRAGIE